MGSAPKPGAGPGRRFGFAARCLRVARIRRTSRTNVRNWRKAGKAGLAVRPGIGPEINGPKVHLNLRVVGLARRSAQLRQQGGA